MSMLKYVFSRKRGRTESDESEDQEPAKDYDTLGLKLLHPGNDPVVDIVAVHGLNGHREETWRADNKTLWLETLLPIDLPYARVYTFGYDSRTHSRDNISRDSFYGHAQTLLTALTLKRQASQTQQRPIIFIAHSLGGLLVKKALVISSLTSDTHLPEQKDVQLATHAIFFFGTPHQGSGVTSWGDISLKISKIYYKTDGRLLQHLKHNSESIESGLGEFASLANSITLKYFYESLPTPIGAGQAVMIVEKSSAVPPSSNTEVIDTYRNHCNMVKFASRSEDLYEGVVTRLSLVVESATAQRPQILQARPIPKQSPSSSESNPVTGMRDNKRSRTSLLVGSVTMRNEKFIGREQELLDIHRFLKPRPGDPSHTSHLTCAIHGLGGIGKTQVAKQYLWSYRSTYSLVAWLRASDIATLAQDFSQIAAKAEGLSGGTQNQSKDIELAREWLVTNHNWLLIFDNLESIELFQQYQPICDHGAFIITTQDIDIAANASMEVRLNKLDNKTGAQLLLSYLKHPDQEDSFEEAELISGELGGLPLAIVHVAGYLRQSQKSLESFLSEYRKVFSQKLADNDTSLYKTQYERTYSTVWSIALNELPRDARIFIDTLAFFSADKVPEDIFLKSTIPIPTHQAIYIPGIDGLANTNIDEMIRHLSRRSLVDRSHGGNNGSTLAIHRQLQRSLILILIRDPITSKRIFATAVNLLRRVFPLQDLVIEQMTKDWPQCALYVDQVLSFHHIYVALGDEAPQSLGYNLTFARILCDCGQYLWEQSLNESAENVLRLAAKLCDGEVPAEKPCALRASIMFRQCSMDIDTGILGIKKAIPRFQAAIKIQQDVLAEMHSSGEVITAEFEMPLANGLNNLGCCYLHLSRYTEAEPLFQESMNIKKKEQYSSTKSMTYEFAEGYKNIAIVKAGQGLIEDALEMSLKSVRMIEEYMGHDSSRTYFFRFIYTCILFDSGETSLALQSHQEILEGRRKTLGYNHNYTASSYYMTGFTLYHLKSYAKAEKAIRESITIWSSGYARQAHVARAKYLLSLVLEAQDSSSEALKLRHDAREILIDLTKGGTEASSIESIKAYDSLVPVWNGRSFTNFS